MQSKDMMRVQLTTRFKWRDRLKLLFGYQLVNEAVVEVVTNGNEEPLRFNYEMKGTRHWMVRGYEPRIPDFTPIQSPAAPIKLQRKLTLLDDAPVDPNLEHTSAKDDFSGLMNVSAR